MGVPEIYNIFRTPSVALFGPADGAFPIERYAGGRLHLPVAPFDVLRRQPCYDEAMPEEGDRRPYVVGGEYIRIRKYRAQSGGGPDWGGVI